MARLTDYADAYARRKKAGGLPGRQAPQFTVPAAALPPAPSLADQARPLPGTSSGRGSFTPATTSAAPNPRGRALRAGLGAALTGAAAAAAAPVSATPGQEFRQSLVRGLMGASAAYGQEQARAERRADRDQSFAERMALLGMRPAKPTAEEAANAERLKAEARLPSQLARIKAQNEAITGRAERLKTMAVKGSKTIEDARLRAMAWDDVMAKLKAEGAPVWKEMPDDATLSAMAQNQFDYLRSGKGAKEQFAFIKNPDEQ